MRDWAKELADAQKSKTGEYFPHSFDGIVEICDVKVVEGRKGNFFCIEAKIVSSTTHPQLEGRERSVMHNFIHDNTLGNIRDFVERVAGGANQVPPEALEELGRCVVSFMDKKGVRQASPLVGLKLSLSTVLLKTKQGKDFTAHNWGDARLEDMPERWLTVVAEVLK